MRMARPIKEVIEECLLLRDESIQFIYEKNSEHFCLNSHFFVQLTIFERVCAFPANLLPQNLSLVLLLKELIQEGCTCSRILPSRSYLLVDDSIN